MIRKLGKDTKIMALLYLGYVLCFAPFMLTLHLPLVADELDVIAAAAHISGDSWVHCIQTLGAYYHKPGMGFLYLPLYLIFRNNGVMMYRSFLLLNVLLLAFLPVIIYRISTKYLKTGSRLAAALISMVSSAVSSLWLYISYARAEVLNILLPSAVVLIMLKLADIPAEKKKEKGIYSIILAFLTVFTFSNHTRGIVIVIAVVIASVWFRLFYRKGIASPLIFYPSLAVFLVIDNLVCKVMTSALYGEYQASHGTLDELKSYNKLFTPKGMKAFGKSFVGWMFNLGTSTLGLGILGVIVCVILLYKLRRKKIIDKNLEIITVITTLIFIGTVLLGLLYFFPDLRKILVKHKGYADKVLYGRYFQPAVPLLCFLALYSIYTVKDKITMIITKSLSLLMSAGFLYVFIRKVCPDIEPLEVRGRYFLSLAGFLTLEDNADSFRVFEGELTRNFIIVGIISICVTAVFFVLTLKGWKKESLRFNAACVLLVIVFAANFVNVFVKVRQSRDFYLDSIVSGVVSEVRQLENDCHLSDKYHNLCLKKYTGKACYYQTALPMFDVGDFKYSKADNQDNFIFICRDDKLDNSAAKLMKLYGSSDVIYSVDGFDYSGRQRVYLYGDEIAEIVKEHGYKVTKITEF